MPTRPLMHRLLTALLRLAPALLPAGLMAGEQAPPGTATAQPLACERKSNCVNSLDSDGLPPLRFQGSREQGMAQLKATLARFPEAEIVAGDATSLSCVFTTLIGFKDDVDFMLHANENRIDFRSRSRVGRSDFGKNRSRMTEVSAAFNQLGQTGSK